uniref:Synaptic vesicle protein n=1 Tax=Riptortus pedestris TaxID=329032 RepID=R4WQZ6_RIPPE|nr:synaptic vesicle protein [Riptortus pedestris]
MATNLRGSTPPSPGDSSPVADADAERSPLLMDSKKVDVLPLEAALTLTGSGLYTAYVTFSAGLALFAGMCNMQMMSVVIPVASCDLNMTSTQKGFLASAAFMGITLSSHLFGFLADICGRRAVLLLCTFTIGVISLLSSLSPTFVVLAACWFAIGFMTGGIFCPAYVFISEYCPQNVRGKCILIASAMSATATAYLPSMSWLIVPLNIQVPLLGNLVFTSWRLFVALVPLTNFIPMFFLYTLSETPKYLLNAGKGEETLELLRSIYSVNKRKPKEEFPLQKVQLDHFDEICQQKEEVGGNPILRMAKKMLVQTAVLFSSKFILYTTTSSLMMIGVLGIYNSFLLWMPEQTKLMLLYSRNNTDFKATMCEVMSHEIEFENTVGSCDLNRNKFPPSIAIGMAQCVTFLLISLIADKVNKKYIIVAITGIPAAAAIALIYVDKLILIVSGIGVIVVFLLTAYPVCLSIAVESFPTSHRSTAASIVLLFGRLAATLGTQFFGYLFHHYCQTAYWAAASVLLGVIIVSVSSPLKRIDEQKEKSKS